LASYTLNLGPTIGLSVGAKAWKTEWDDNLCHIKQIFICLDSDKAGREGAKKLAYHLGTDRTLIVKLPPDMGDLNDCITHNISKEVIVDCLGRAKSIHQLEIIEAIECIPKDEKLIGKRINEEVLPLISEQPRIEVQDYLEIMKDRWSHLSYKQVLDFRKEIDHIVGQKQYAQNNPKPKKAPVVLSDEEEEQAMGFLRSPTILQDLEKYLDVGIVGERENKVCLWIFMLTRKLPKQIHAVVFGQSSSGKSEMVKAVLSTIPDDEVLEFSSLTARSLEYADNDMLVGKVVSIAEMDGFSNDQDVEYIVRTAMSEGKLNRAHTEKNYETGELETVTRVVPVKSVFVLTTTRSNIHNENDTRVFSLYANESVGQTKKIASFIRQAQSREWKLAEAKRVKVSKLLKNAQTLLRPVDLSIPYAEHISFPETTTRHRRDLNRFFDFIKTVAFLRQHQKERKQDDIGYYTEADLDDYKWTYEYLLPILANTLDDISPRGVKLLEVCCLLQDEIKKDDLIQDEQSLTLKLIQKKAKTLDIDLRNSVNVRNELRELCEQEYLELTSGQWGQRGSRQKFKVSCEFHISADGIVENIANKKLPILTPDELAVKIEVPF